MATSKNDIRQAFIARLRQLDPTTKQNEEKKLYTKLFVQQAWLDAKTVAVTMSMGFEIDTHPIILRGQEEGKQVLVPRTLPDHQMEFVTVDESSQFAETSFGVMEPVGGKVLKPDQIDLVIVPGVAFTKSGKRLGFGGGYYDRYLAAYKGNTIALALDVQLADEDAWTSEKTDIKVDTVVSSGDDQ